MNVASFGLGAPSAKIAATAVASAALQLPSSGNTVRITNRGVNHVYVQFGDETVAAVVPGASLISAPTVCQCVPANSTAIFERNASVHRFVSTICEATESATVIISVGDGGVDG